jgi:hypothetical protein
MMIRSIFLLLLVGTVPAYAQDWRAMQAACGEAAEQQCAAIGGANCSGWWPAKARCVLQNVGAYTTPGVLIADPETCIAQEQARRTQQRLPNGRGDPVAEVIFCATGWH